MKKLLLVLFAIVLVFGAVFSGCGEPTSTTTTITAPAVTTTTTAPAVTTTTTAPAVTTTTTTTAEPTTTEAPQYGGTLKMIFTRAPSLFGIPANATGASRMAASGCLEYLIVTDQQGKSYPWLVESWELSPDQTYYIFHLRKGVKFHDGANFNAEAVKWNLEQNQKGVPGLQYISSIDIVDEYTVRLNITQYFDVGIFQLIGGLMISPTAYATHGEDWCSTHPVGTGPFEFVSYEPNVSLKYKKFNDYWQKGKPYLDALEYVYITDPTIAAMSFRSGEGQVLCWASAQQASDLEKEGFKSFSMPSVFNYLAGDSAHPTSAFSNQLVREAMEYALDKEPMIKGLGYGYRQPLYQICPPQYYGYNPDIKGRTYDPDKAKQLLDQAGFPNGFKTRLIAIQGDDDFMVAIAQDLQSAGINAELEMAGRNEFVNYLLNGWDDGILNMNWGLFPDAAQSLKTQITGRIPVTLRPPEWDSMVDEAFASADYVTRVKLTQQVVKAAYDFAMVAPTWVNTSIFMTDSSVHDHNICQLSDFEVWTPESVWLSK